MEVTGGRRPATTYDPGQESYKKRMMGQDTDEKSRTFAWFWKQQFGWKNLLHLPTELVSSMLRHFYSWMIISVGQFQTESKFDDTVNEHRYSLIPKKRFFSGIIRLIPHAISKRD